MKSYKAFVAHSTSDKGADGNLTATVAEMQSPHLRACSRRRAGELW
jgi:hypothetical protein